MTKQGKERSILNKEVLCDRIAEIADEGRFGFTPDEIVVRLKALTKRYDELRGQK